MNKITKLTEKIKQSGSIWLFDQNEDMPLSEANGERLTDKEKNLLIAAADRVAGEDFQRVLNYLSSRTQYDYSKGFVGCGYTPSKPDDTSGDLGRESIVRHILRPVRGCATDEQYQESFRRCSCALELAGEAIRKAALALSPGKVEGWRETPAFNSPNQSQVTNNK